MSGTSIADSYSPEDLAKLQEAFSAVWATLYPHMSTDDESGKELSVRLTRTLMALDAAGVTKPKELRRKALEVMALNPR
jgi:hypothetical protein